MKKSYILPLILIALSLLLFLHSKNGSIFSKEKIANKNSFEVSKPIDSNSPSKLVIKDNKRLLVRENEKGQVVQTELSEDEASVVQLAQIFKSYAGTQRNEKDFITDLLSLGLKPVVARDRQEVIEDLTIIRPENTLPGVRYIHGQFDGDETQELQHISFEIKKGPNALEQGKKLVSESMGLGEPVKNVDPKMVLYKMDGYVVWLKELSWEDMMGDPFNAYSKEDVGNVRIAIERDIHDHSDHGS
ncbi:hypothetical protein GW916_01850 [bacterium]|nr:hypothetical protein [bacterium]